MRCAAIVSRPGSWYISIGTRCFATMRRRQPPPRTGRQCPRWSVLCAPSVQFSPAPRSQSRRRRRFTPVLEIHLACYDSDQATYRWSMPTLSRRVPASRARSTGPVVAGSVQPAATVSEHPWRPRRPRVAADRPDRSCSTLVGRDVLRSSGATLPARATRGLAVILMRRSAYGSSSRTSDATNVRPRSQPSAVLRASTRYCPPRHRIQGTPASAHICSHS